MADGSIPVADIKDMASDATLDGEEGLVDLGPMANAADTSGQSSTDMGDEKLNSLMSEGQSPPTPEPGPIGIDNLPNAVDPVGLGEIAAVDNLSGDLGSQPAATGGQLESLGVEKNTISKEPLPLNNSAGSRPQQTNLGGDVLDLHTIKNIKVNVQAVLGGISMSVSKLANLKEGELVSLEKNIGDEIEILANGQLIAHGEIVVIEGDVPKFGITLTEIVGSGISE